jgi:hypothetical protein
MTEYKYDYIEKLEIGAGANPREGYVHLDLNPNVGTDILADASKPLPLKDGCVGELLAINIIEHIEWSSIKDTLKEWARIVKPGGIIKIHTNDITGVIDLITKDDPDWNKDIGYQPFGGNEDKWAYLNHFVMSTHAPYNMHRAVFTKPMMKKLLSDAGFGDFVELFCGPKMMYIQGTKK